MVERVLQFVKNREDAIPLYADRVQAGFPSPAEGLLDEMIDLNSYLVKNPQATFLLRVSGESMTGAGIFPDDLLVVDRSEEAKSGQIVVAVVDNEFTVKRFIRHSSSRKNSAAREKGRIELRAENPDYRSVPIEDESEVKIWGVVRHTIRSA
jgi:DNA polymerase V